LKQHIEFNSFALPVCLPTLEKLYDYSHQGEVLISGWGQVSDDLTSRTPDKLQVPKLKIHDPVDCKRKWTNYYNRIGRIPHKQFALTDDQFCANADGVENCSGDSGGATVKELDGRYFVVEIVSYGPKPCREEVSPPGVYTKTTNHIEWIIETLSQKDTMEEIISSLHCNKEEFSCQNGQCISTTKVYDSHSDCKNGFYEINCDHQCGVKDMSEKIKNHGWLGCTDTMHLKNGRH
jgi:hypothetical protein